MTGAPRLDPLEVRRTLRREGLRAQHSRSQNFLADPEVLQAILDLAEVSDGTRVLEIGPGLGILTGGLLAGGAQVTAIELDRGLAAYLRQQLSPPISEGRLDDSLHTRVCARPGAAERNQSGVDVRLRAEDLA